MLPDRVARPDDSRERGSAAASSRAKFATENPSGTHVTCAGSDRHPHNGAGRSRSASSTASRPSARMRRVVIRSGWRRSNSSVRREP